MQDVNRDGKHNLKAGHKPGRQTENPEGRMLNYFTRHNNRLADSAQRFVIINESTIFVIQRP